MPTAQISKPSTPQTPLKALSKGGRQPVCLTQAERLYAHLRRRAMTNLEMVLLGVCACPWKRLEEGVHHLRKGEWLDRQWNAQGLRTYRVKRVR